MRFRARSILGWSFAALTAASVSAAHDSSSLPHDQETKLSAWYRAVGAPRADESFGGYLARAARVQHGAAYEALHPPPGRESLRVNLDRFECVSFIESSLAVARCGWRREPSADCFASELVAFRYRGGSMGDYASRLHYFVDWIEDNEARGRLVDLTEALGGQPITREFSYISSRELTRPIETGGDVAKLRREIAAVEARLSAAPHAVLPRSRARSILTELKDGDLVAFVRERPGLLVHHAGFVYRADGAPRLLHASSYHRRVVLTIRDLSDYLLRRPERRGFLVVRPLAP